MTSRTITITAPNGAKVRTVHSKRFFVVSFREVTTTYNRVTGEFDRHEPKAVASVERRTDSAVSARTVLRKLGHAGVVFTTSVREGVVTVRALERNELAILASTEKAHKDFLDRRGNQGEARRLAY